MVEKGIKSAKGVRFPHKSKGFLRKHSPQTRIALILFSKDSKTKQPIILGFWWTPYIVNSNLNHRGVEALYSNAVAFFFKLPF